MCFTKRRASVLTATLSASACFISVHVLGKAAEERRTRLVLQYEPPHGYGLFKFEISNKKGIISPLADLTLALRMQALKAHPNPNEAISSSGSFRNAFWTTATHSMKLASTKSFPNALQ
jgi:hypothetical protein